MVRRFDPDRTDLMTVAQVASYLQLNKLTVHRYIRDGRIPASKLGKAYRVRKSDVDAVLEAHKVQMRASRPSGDRREGRPPVAHQPLPSWPPEEISVAPQRPRVSESRMVQFGISPLEWVGRWLH